jgi:hypothetical protein
MFSKMLSRFTLPLLLLLSNSTEVSLAQPSAQNQKLETGTLEKMIASNGVVAMDLNWSEAKGNESASSALKPVALRFAVSPDSFFTALVFNNVFRGIDGGSMSLALKGSDVLPAALNASINQLIVEKADSTAAFDLMVRDGKTGFTFFNIAGHSYEYDASKHVLKINDGRLLISNEFAARLGNSSQSNSVAGKISITMTMYPIEVDKLVNGTVQSATMPPMQPSVGTIPGPDVIVGDLPSVEQPSGASVGGFIGVGVGTTSCNAGVVDLDWFALPSNDHPAIPQNMYRMSAGIDNTERFEQIGQSWCKHAFTALTQNVCSFGCNGTGGTHLGSGCSDPYSASLNYEQARLGSRAWINPFTGVYPRGDSATNPNSHSGHSHNSTSHRVLIAISDLSTTANPGATYFAEALYVTPHEFLWCQNHHGECNQYNNVSYRRFNVVGTTSPFAFPAVGATVRTQAAINAWTGATRNAFEPDPGKDGIGIVGYKVTNPSAGVWHYEYAVYNQNLDRAIQSFSVPLGCGVTVSNLGFHAPPQSAAFAADGTVGNTGYSNTAWASDQTFSALAWNSETLAQNPNANAIRWGTLYNFRFDSNKPPQAANATLAFFKTGAPITVAIQAPTPDTCNVLQVVTAVSRKTHGGAGDFNIDLPLSGEPGVECRDGGVNGDHTIVVTLSNDVVSGNASVTGGTGSVSGSPTFSNNTMTVNLTGVADVQQIVVTLNNVMDSFNQTLADTTVTMNVLMGDTSGNKGVTSTDLSQTKLQSGQPVDATNFRDDVVPDGSINSTDLGAIKLHSGSGLP